MSKINLTEICKRILKEDKEGFNDVYYQYIENHYPYLVDQIKAIERQFPDAIIRQSDSENLYIKWAEQTMYQYTEIHDNIDIIYLLGLVSEKGKLLKSDYSDIMKWVNMFLNKIRNKHVLITSPNEMSRPIVDNILKRIKNEKDIIVTGLDNPINVMGDKYWNIAVYHKDISDNPFLTAY